MRFLALLLCAFVVVTPASAADTVGTKIVKFCQENLEKKVGDGDCYDLAQHALKAGGAKPQFRNPDKPNKGDYVWGELVLLLEATPRGLKPTGKIRDIKPGDVIQFRDTKWAGVPPSGRGRYSMSFSHHTAVVSGVAANGLLLGILHQNYRGQKKVLSGTLKLADLKEGWIRIYRPVAGR